MVGLVLLLTTAVASRHRSGVMSDSVREDPGGYGTALRFRAGQEGNYCWTRLDAARECSRTRSGARSHGPFEIAGGKEKCMT